MSTQTPLAEGQDHGTLDLVNALLVTAVRERASDIHVEAAEDGLRVRLRVDGIAVEQPPVTAAMRQGFLAHLKNMAGLNIAEKRLPQDGRIQLTIEGRRLDLRVSTVPTIHGETMTLRILDTKAVQLRLEQVCDLPETCEAIKALLAKPNGLILVNGPTGSGKTTLLYAMLAEVNLPKKVVFAIEDPVEYAIPGVNQLAVQPAIGLSFSRLLRSVMRQDPDVVMIGEIRDVETLQVAIQVAITGHLVLSTLHTNSAVSAVRRLLDLGVEPYLLRSGLAGVISQRLVRRLCPDCKRQAPLPDYLTDELRAELSALSITTHWEPVGCDKCRQTGYRGRLALHEILRPGPALLAAIDRQLPIQDLRSGALADGWRELRHDGWRRVALGHTSLHEVLLHCRGAAND
jgi:general secretion pathway protein E